MAWEVHALGNLTRTAAYEAAAEIITQELGDCTFTSSTKWSYTFGGETYSLTLYAGTTAYDAYLFINKETGEFVLSNTNTQNASSMSDTMYAAILLLQMDAETVKLVPTGTPLNNAPDVFAISNSSANTTPVLSLRPAFTGKSYNTAVANCAYRPVVNMFEYLGYNITAGTYVQVDGQTFLCVAQRLFVKV